jgi:50S ribosomal protein L16 3-hydroxylase
MTTRRDPVNQPLPLLGGLTPNQFMRDYWQKKPLVVRQAFPNPKPPVRITDLKKLSRRDDVESRLIWRDADSWQMKHGPFGRLPAAQSPNWTLLVQSVDLHDDAAADLLYQFNFVPSARLDDLMISIASEGGGVGPHFDSYDVFLIQAQGRRRWRFGQQQDLSLVPDLPLKILSRFTPEEDVVLEPGDMLYLPPNAAHDGISLDHDCMTLSVGFKAPTAAMMAQRMLEAAADSLGLETPARLKHHFRDPSQRAVSESAQLPERLIQAALKSVRQVALNQSLAVECLGAWLTEPNQMARFESTEGFIEPGQAGQIKLDRRTRMLFWQRALFINGEKVPTAANALLKQLANSRSVFLTPTQTSGKSHTQNQTLDTLNDWLDAGWIHWQENTQ